MEKLLEKIEKTIVLTVVFLLPFAVVSSFANPYVVTKLAILAYGVILALIIRSIRIVTSGKLELSLSGFDFPVLLLAAAYIASTVLRTQNKMEALLLPGVTTLFVGAILLFYLINQFSKKDKDTLVKIMVYSGGIFSLLTLLSTIGLFDKIPQLPAFIRSKLFTPTGGYLPAAMYLATILPIGLGLVFSEKIMKKKAPLALSLAFSIAGLGLSIYNIIPGRPTAPRFPSFNTSWYIAVDTLKASPLMGVGPGNYITAFNRFRPLTYNNSDLWPIKFSTANNFYLTIMTEAGLLGTAAIILLLLSIYKLVRKDFKEKKLVGWGFAGSASLVSLIIITILFALFPATPTTLVAFFVLLALNATTTKTTLNLKSEVSSYDSPAAVQGVASRLPALLVTIPVLAATLYTGFQATKFIRAEAKFRTSLVALAQNEGVRSYDTMREAIQINPLVDRYHSSYAQVNLALANAIAANPEITDQDRANIAQLIQQSIREGKATVALNPLRAGNWEVLARIYQAIQPLAQGADAFAAQTFAQAIALDPINPNLRIALGGIYYGVGNYETAIRIFELAAQTKADLANSHYNLAYALFQNGNYQRAVGEMSLVLSLVDRNTPDYEAARKAMEEMEAKRDEVTAQGSANLTPPTQPQEPALEPPLELPEESEPPEAPITPTPTPEEGAQATVTPAAQ